MTLENLTTAMTNITTLVGDVLGIIGGNAVLMLFFSVGIIGSIVGVVSRLKNA